MITNKSFTKEWIESFRQQKEYRKIDPALLEKMIHALALVEKLTQHDFEFIFKGGTSLILLLKKPFRFSVDVDITTPVGKSELEKVLNEVIENSHFTSWSIDERENDTDIPKAHYIFEFKSVFNKASNNILLDVIFDDIPYSSTVMTPINSAWLKTEEPVQKVRTPTVDAILGDKLTAFAPNTIGVPYKSNKDIEIIKQLFDIYSLLDKVSDIETIKKTYDSVSEKQFKYLKKELSQDSVLQDTINTALILAKRNNNKGEDLEKFQELQGGIIKFNNFLMSGNFRIEKAQSASARAAYLASKLQTQDYSKLRIYKSDTDIADLEINNQDFSFLNRFKKTNRETFFYWCQCLSIKGQLER